MAEIVHTRGIELELDKAGACVDQHCDGGFSRSRTFNSEVTDSREDVILSCRGLYIDPPADDFYACECWEEIQPFKIAKVERSIFDEDWRREGYVGKMAGNGVEGWREGYMG